MAANTDGLAAGLDGASAPVRIGVREKAGRRAVDGVAAADRSKTAGAADWVGGAAARGRAKDSVAEVPALVVSDAGSAGAAALLHSGAREEADSRSAAGAAGGVSDGEVADRSKVMGGVDWVGGAFRGRASGSAAGTAAFAIISAAGSAGAAALLHSGAREEAGSRSAGGAAGGVSDGEAADRSKVMGGVDWVSGASRGRASGSAAGTAAFAVISDTGSAAAAALLHSGAREEAGSCSAGGAAGGVADRENTTARSGVTGRVDWAIIAPAGPASPRRTCPATVACALISGTGTEGFASDSAAGVLAGSVVCCEPSGQVTAELRHSNLHPLFGPKFGEEPLSGVAVSSGVSLSTKPSSNSGNCAAAAGALRSHPFAAAPDAAGNDCRSPMEAAADGARDGTLREKQIAGQTSPMHFQRVDRVGRANELPPMAGAAGNCRTRRGSLDLSSAGIREF